MKTCPICRTLFEPAVPHQEYDRLTCRKKAARQRERIRDKGLSIQTKGRYGAADHATMMNPTVSSLDEMARVYLNNPTALPTIFTGMVPEWTPPEGIEFAKQAGDEILWLMKARPAVDIMALYAQNQGSAELTPIS